MADVNSLLSRIDAEFKAKDERIQNFQKQGVKEYRDREARLAKFGGLTDELRGVWEPRLMALAKRFGEHVKLTPTVERERREALFSFRSNLASIQLRFSATTNGDATKAIFNYDLRIIPILMQFESHSELEFPLDGIDKDKLAAWIDDRIVTFVRTYLALHENEYYLKDQMVEDPVTHVRFPKEAAGATLDRNGKTYYFVGEETKREFEKKESAKKEPAKQAEVKKEAAKKDEPKKTDAKKVGAKKQRT